MNTWPEENAEGTKPTASDSPFVSGIVTPAGAPLPPNAVPSYLLPAVLSLLCCCFPSGIVALLYAIRVSTRLSAGDLTGAEQASRQARLWVVITVCLGVLFSVLAMLVQLASQM